MRTLVIIAVALAACRSSAERDRQVATCASQPGNAAIGRVSACLTLHYGWKSRDADAAEGGPPFAIALLSFIH